MLDKYRATIHGNTIVWNGKVPESLIDKNTTVEVNVEIISPKTEPRKPDGAKMVEALEKLSALGGVKSIPDPDAWLRETRRDRPLPGRE